MNILMYPRLIEAKLSMNSVTALKFVSFVPSLPSIFTCNIQELSTFIMSFFRILYLSITMKRGIIVVYNYQFLQQKFCFEVM